MAYFSGQRTNFTIPLHPANFSSARQHWLNFMASIPYGAHISYATFAAATRAAGTACIKNPVLIIYPYHRVVRKNAALGRCRGGSQLEPSHKNNVAYKGVLIAHEESQLDEGQLILS